MNLQYSPSCFQCKRVMRLGAVTLSSGYLRYRTMSSEILYTFLVESLNAPARSSLEPFGHNTLCSLAGKGVKNNSVFRFQIFGNVCHHKVAVRRHFCHWHARSVDCCSERVWFATAFNLCVNGLELLGATFCIGNDESHSSPTDYNSL